MHQKMYQRQEKKEKTTGNPKNSRRLQRCQATSQESNLQRRKCSLQRLRMNEEKSLHHVKGLPMSLVNSTKKQYDDNEQDEYGNESNTDVHINDTEEMTRIPEITSEELQDAISKLKIRKITDSDGIRAEDIKACDDETNKRDVETDLQRNHKAKRIHA